MLYFLLLLRENDVSHLFDHHFPCAIKIFQVYVNVLILKNEITNKYQCIGCGNAS